MTTITKPENWMDLLMFQKIHYYGLQLTDFYADYVDKLKAKIKVKEICGNDDINIPKVIRILENYSDIRDDDLDTNYIIKSAHGSGWNININDSSITKEIVTQKLKTWNHKYYGSNEKQYSFLEPRFFIEEKICDSLLGKTGEALVYMIRCIHSKPITISVKYKKTQNTYDINWNLIQIPKIPFSIPKPECLLKLLNLCTKLSANFEFVRLDFYLGINDTIYFSEFTFTPAGGFRVFDLELEKKQGLLWT